MKILFCTIDMVEGVERLMPWRTLVEAAKNVALLGHYETAICSAQSKVSGERSYQGVMIHQIRYGVEELIRFVECGRWEVVFYPVSYRMGLQNLTEFSKIPARMIAYVPGGLYPLSGVVALGTVGGLRLALPYLLETFTPHCLLTRKLKRAGFSGIVSQSPLTTRDAIRSGWTDNEALTALPGLDEFAELEGDPSLLETLRIRAERFLLFCGAPAQIRGSRMVLRAIDRIADRLPDVRLVMLMRKDVSSDFTAFERLAACSKHKDRILISYERVTPAQLKAFFSEAYAVLLPFLLVPSEIPLTYFEVMACGTPVISYENAGTTDYLRAALKLVPKRTVGGLAQAMSELCHNPDERNMLARKSKELMNRHPSWEESAKIWMQAIEHSVS